MATLNITSREGEIIRLPLTTEWLGIPCLVIYYDGCYYRCPIVRDVDPLASAVKIRYKRKLPYAANTYIETYALSKAIFNPFTHDTTGKTQWQVDEDSTLRIYEAGKLTFLDGAIYCTIPTRINVDTEITFSAKLKPTTVDKTQRTIFEIYNPTEDKSLSVVINTANKCSILLDGTAVKTEGTAVQANTVYTLSFSSEWNGSNATLSLKCAGSSAVTVSKTYSLGTDCRWYIGRSHTGLKWFLGEMAEVTANDAKFYFCN